MRKKHGVNPFARSIVGGFLLVALSSEGMHPEHASPHTRREEEFKEEHDELVEAMRAPQSFRHIAIGGGKNPVDLETAIPNTAVLTVSDAQLFLPEIHQGQLEYKVMDLGLPKTRGINGPGGFKV